MKYIFLILATLIALTLQGSEAILLSDSTEKISIGKDISYFHDKTGSLAISSIAEKSFQPNFSSVNEDNLYVGYYSGAYWITFRLKNALPHPETFYIEFNEPLTDDVRLYEKMQPSGYRETTIGDIYPFYQRAIQHRSPVFPVRFASGEEKQLFMRISGNSSLTLALSVWKPSTFLSSSLKEYFYLGTFISLSIIMVFIGFLLMTLFRDQMFFYFSLYILFYSLMQMGLIGVANQYIWPLISEYNDKLFTLSGYLTTTFLTLFVYSFLNLEKQDYWQRYLVRGNTIFSIAGCFFIFLPWFDTVIRFSAFYIIFTACYMFAVLLSKAGKLQAKILLITFGMMFSTTALFALNKFFKLSPTLFQGTMQIISISITVVFMGVGVAYYMVKLKGEKEHIEKESRMKLEKAHEDLRAAYNRLEKLDSSKSEFLQLISHELRTPLNGILGTIELLKDDLANNRESFETLDLSAKRLERFSNLALLITNLNLDQNHVHMDKSPLIKLINNAVAPMKNSAGKKNILLTYNIDTVHNTVCVDEELFITALSGIFENAVIYSPEHAQITIQTWKKDNLLHLEIQDQGNGFPQELLSDNISLFYKSKSAKHYEGLGLSIPLARLVMEAHHGSFTFGNRKQGGAWTRFSFPVD